MRLAKWTADNVYDYNDHKNTNVSNKENNENNNSHSDIDDYDNKDNPLQRKDINKKPLNALLSFLNQF